MFSPTYIYIKTYPQCNGRCQSATNEKCQCQCQGRYHGFMYRKKRKNIRKNKAA